MANADAPSGFRLEKTFGNNAVFPMDEVVIDTNTTVTEGDLLVRNSAGYGTVALPSNLNILGVAAESVTGRAGVRPAISFIPALEGLVFSAQCSGSLTQAMIGTEVDFEGTTGIMEVNEDASTYDQLVIVDLAKQPPGNALGANARVLVMIKNSQYTGQNM